MANVKQLEILEQGVETWNQWRKDNLDTKIDLYKANFRNANFAYANFSDAYLLDVNFDNANLRDAIFTDAFLVRAHFCGADLSRADLTRATLRESDLRGANLVGTNLDKANLHYANLHTADLRFPNLNEANFLGVQLGYTVLGFTNLSEVSDLGRAKHYGPSNIGHEALANSRVRIPQAFLRGCGLSDWEIESAKLYSSELSNYEIDEILYKVHDLRATQPLQISPLFISYSHADSAFVDKIEKQLDAKGIRFW